MTRQVNWTCDLCQAKATSDDLPEGWRSYVEERPNREEADHLDICLPCLRKRRGLVPVPQIATSSRDRNLYPMDLKVLRAVEEGGTDYGSIRHKVGPVEVRGQKEAGLGYAYVTAVFSKRGRVSGSRTRAEKS